MITNAVISGVVIEVSIGEGAAILAALAAANGRTDAVLVALGDETAARQAAIASAQQAIEETQTADEIRDQESKARDAALAATLNGRIDAAVSAIEDAQTADENRDAESKARDNLKLDKAGGTVTGPINMSGNRIEGVGAPNSDDDVARMAEVTGAANQRLAITGGSLFGLLNMQGNRVENIGDPDTPDDAAKLRNVLDLSDELYATLGTSGFEAMGMPRDLPPAAAVPFNARTFVFLDPFDYAGSVDGITLYALKSGPLYFSTWRKDGANFVRLSEITLQATSAGINSFFKGDASGFEGIPHGPGEFFGFCAVDGLLSFNSAPPDGSGIISAPSRTLGFADTNETYTKVRAQIRIESGYFNQPLSARRVLRAVTPRAPTAPTSYYAFMIAGQSNAVCFSDALSPDVPADRSFVWRGSSFDFTRDPIGAAPGGSAWAVFANEFYARTGFGTIFIPTAVGGSSMLAASDQGPGNWSATGSLRTASVTAVRNALAASTLPVQFGGVLWSQGESDADWIANSHPVQDYVAGFENLLDFYAGEFGAKSPFIIARTGMRPDGSAPASWKAVRDAQDDLARRRANVSMGWTGALTLRTRGLMHPDGSYHYSQAAYDEMGQSLAAVAAAVSLGHA